jgi:uncharacterized integral membrane protein
LKENKFLLRGEEWVSEEGERNEWVREWTKAVIQLTTHTSGLFFLIFLCIIFIVCNVDNVLMYYW